MERTYTVIMYDSWKRPYYATKDSNICETENAETYKTTSIELCKQIVKDLLDAPLAELSLEEIHKEFDGITKSLSEEQAVHIQKYYNGRLAICNTIMSDLDSSVSSNETKTLHYDIPEEYNRFDIGDDEEYNKHTKQLETYIEVLVK